MGFIGLDWVDWIDWVDWVLSNIQPPVTVTMYIYHPRHLSRTRLQQANMKAPSPPPKHTDPYRRMLPSPPYGLMPCVLPIRPVTKVPSEFPRGQIMVDEEVRGPLQGLSGQSCLNYVESLLPLGPLFALDSWCVPLHL